MFKSECEVKVKGASLIKPSGGKCQLTTKKKKKQLLKYEIVGHIFLCVCYQHNSLRVSPEAHLSSINRTFFFFILFFASAVVWTLPRILLACARYLRELT